MTKTTSKQHVVGDIIQMDKEKDEAITLEIHDEKVYQNVSRGPSSPSNNNNLWLCCGTTRGFRATDSRIIRYLFGYLMSLIMIFFCIYQLLNKLDMESQNAYLSIITLILGIYLPSPKISHN